VVGQLANRSDLAQEFSRRQQDIEKIDAKIVETQGRIEGTRLALARTAADYDASRRKARRLIITQDQAAGADPWSLILSSSDVARTLVDLHVWATLLSTAARELAEGHGRGAALESELDRLDKETSNLQEIKSLLEKRQKELKNELTLSAAGT
jgi:peptidoglycan hydrolase CwlO-like protein